MRSRSSLLNRTELTAQEALQRANDSGGGGGPGDVPVQLRYVTKTGSDVTGNGSFDLPFGTVQHALTSITDNAAGKPYVILVGGGIYAGGMLLKDFVTVEGVDPSDKPQFGGALGLDAGYAGGQTGITNLSFNAPQNVPFGAIASPNFQVNDCTFGAALVLSGTGATVFSIRRSRIVGATTITDCFQLSTIGNVFEGIATISAISESGTWISSGDAFRANVNVSATVPNTVAASSVASQITGTLTLTGVGATYSGTAGAVPPVVSLVGGASAPVKLTSANGLAYTATTVADWSGVNPTSIQNALDRIAAKITPIP